jgi:hypothetical protein
VQRGGVDAHLDLGPRRVIAHPRRPAVGENGGHEQRFDPSEAARLEARLPEQPKPLGLALRQERQHVARPDALQENQASGGVEAQAHRARLGERRIALGHHSQPRRREQRLRALAVPEENGGGLPAGQVLPALAAALALDDVAQDRAVVVQSARGVRSHADAQMAQALVGARLERVRRQLARHALDDVRLQLERDRVRHHSEDDRHAEPNQRRARRERRRLHAPRDRSGRVRALPLAGCLRALADAGEQVTGIARHAAAVGYRARRGLASPTR